MIVKVDNKNLISSEFRKYLFKKKVFRTLLDMNYISLEEFEKSIMQLKEKYIRNNQIDLIDWIWWLFWK